MSKNLLDILNNNKREEEVKELKEKIRSERSISVISKEVKTFNVENDENEKPTIVYSEKEKITTRDCVDQIIKKYPKFGKNWKRSAKYRTDPTDILRYKKIDYDEYKNFYIREFINKDHIEQICFVVSSPTKIYHVECLQQNNNVKLLFQKYLEIKEDENSEEDSRDLIKVIAPCIKSTGFWDDGGWEALNMENYKLKEIRDSEVDIWHGGDWQEPKTVTYRYMNDGLLYWDSKKSNI